MNSKKVAYQEFIAGVSDEELKFLFMLNEAFRFAVKNNVNSARQAVLLEEKLREQGFQARVKV